MACTFKYNSPLGKEVSFTADTREELRNQLVRYIMLNEAEVYGELKNNILPYKAGSETNFVDADNDISKEALFSFFANDFLSSMSLMNLLYGDARMMHEDFKDATKRNGNLISAGSQTGVGMTTVAVIADKKIDLAERNSLIKTNNTKTKYEPQDGQSYTSVHWYMDKYLPSLARYSKPVKDAFMKIRAGIPLTSKETSLLKVQHASFIDRKMVGKSLFQLLKTSTHLQTREKTSYIDYQGRNKEEVHKKLLGLWRQYDNAANEIEQRKVLKEIHSYYKPQRHRQYHHQMLNDMEMRSTHWVAMGTASKTVSTDVGRYNEAEGFFELTPHLMPDTGILEQVKTDNLKSEIIHGTQLQGLVWSEQAGDEQKVETPSGIKTTVGELRKVYAQLLAERTIRGLNAKRSELFTEEGEVNYELIHSRIISGMQSSSPDTQLLELLSLDDKGKPKYNWNLPVLHKKLQNLLLNYLSKDSLKHVVEGQKYTLVSAVGHEVLFDKKTGRVVPTSEYLRNPSKYEGDAYGTRDLQFGRLENGVYYSEAIVPQRVLDKFGIKVGQEIAVNGRMLAQMGVRIPTQDKHSMVVLKIVDSLPELYENSVILPYEVVFLSGADFDIDSLFARNFYSYKIDKKAYFFGQYHTAENPVEQAYKEWQHSKEVERLYSKEIAEWEDSDNHLQDLLQRLARFQVAGEVAVSVEGEDYKGLTKVLDELYEDGLKEAIAEQRSKIREVVSSQKMSLKEFSKQHGKQILVNVAAYEKGSLSKVKAITNEELNNLLLEAEIGMSFNEGNAANATTKASLEAFEKAGELFKQWGILTADEVTGLYNAMDKLLAQQSNDTGKKNIGPGALHNIMFQLLAERKTQLIKEVRTKAAANHAMKYAMPAADNLTGAATTTLELAEQGLRTATTRSFPLGKIGDIITFEGRPTKYIITGIETLTKENTSNPEWIKQWSQKEQWTEKHFKEILGGKTVHIGSVQTSFRIATEEELLQRSDEAYFGKYTEYGSFTNSKRERINDLISTVISGMTDNAKHLFAARFELTFEQVGPFMHMISMGMPFTEALLLVRQPILTIYQDILEDKKRLVKKRGVLEKETIQGIKLDKIAQEAARRLYENLFGDKIEIREPGEEEGVEEEATAIGFDEALVKPQPFEVGEDSLMKMAIQYQSGAVPNPEEYFAKQVYLLNDYKRIVDDSKSLMAFSQVLQLIKGFKTTFAESRMVTQALENLGLEPHFAKLKEEDAKKVKDEVSIMTLKDGTLVATFVDKSTPGSPAMKFSLRPTAKLAESPEDFTAISEGIRDVLTTNETVFARIATDQILHRDSAQIVIRETDTYTDLVKEVNSAVNQFYLLNKEGMEKVETALITFLNMRAFAHLNKQAKIGISDKDNALRLMAMFKLMPNNDSVLRYIFDRLRTIKEFKANKFLNFIRMDDVEITGKFNPLANLVMGKIVGDTRSEYTPEYRQDVANDLIALGRAGQKYGNLFEDENALNDLPEAIRQLTPRQLAKLAYDMAIHYSMLVDNMQYRNNGIAKLINPVAWKPVAEALSAVQHVFNNKPEPFVYRGTEMKLRSFEDLFGLSRDELIVEFMTLYSRNVANSAEVRYINAPKMKVVVNKAADGEVVTFSGQPSISTLKVNLNRIKEGQWGDTISRLATFGFEPRGEGLLRIPQVVKVGAKRSPTRLMHLKKLWWHEGGEDGKTYVYEREPYPGVAEGDVTLHQVVRYEYRRATEKEKGGRIESTKQVVRNFPLVGRGAEYELSEWIIPKGVVGLALPLYLAEYTAAYVRQLTKSPQRGAKKEEKEEKEGVPRGFTAAAVTARDFYNALAKEYGVADVDGMEYFTNPEVAKRVEGYEKEYGRKFKVVAKEINNKTYYRVDMVIPSIDKVTKRLECG